MLIRISTILLLFSLGAWGQKDPQSYKVNDCYGAEMIDHPGDFTFHFTGRTGDDDDLSGLPSLSDFDVKNSFWASFKAPHDGLLMFDAFCPKGAMNVAVFTSNADDICADIHRGAAEIERKLSVDARDTFGFNKTPDNNFLYGIPLLQGQEIYIFFNSTAEERLPLHLKVNYESKDVSEKEIDENIKLKDYRTDKDLPDLTLRLRDRATGLPVDGQMIIKGSRKKDGLYKGTDFLFSLGRRTNMTMSIDAPGYFFRDEEESLEGNHSKEIELWLEPAAPGEKIELEGIRFNMGTSDFASGAKQKLNRLKEFMTVNSDIHIEIQGHVHSVGKNSFAGRRLSLARAKKVMSYLEEQGIDKSRMSAEGFGNEHMVYPEPKFSWQEQANRRVEIKIVSP
ncbi:MAG: OmpA family protein [Bacteroidota bacterium]